MNATLTTPTAGLDVGPPDQKPITSYNTHPPITPTPPDQADWARHGTCRTDPKPDRWVALPELRVHGINNPAYIRRTTQLKNVCTACPVNNACLWTALTNTERVDGIWGGTDEYERADMRAAMGAPQPAPAGIPPLNENDAATDLALTERFTAQRLAHKGYGNKQIATLMGASPMTISRYMAGKGRPNRSRTEVHRPKPHTTKRSRPRTSAS